MRKLRNDARAQSVHLGAPGLLVSRSGIVDRGGRRFCPILLLLVAFGARADVVTDWADLTTEIADEGPNTIRTMALAQSAVYEAVNAITARYPSDRVKLGSAQGASIEAAVAAASRAVLLQEAPALKERIEPAYARTL